MRILYVMVAWALCAMSCANNKAAVHQAAGGQSSVPQFDADSAYALVARQCEFGPRVPGTSAHAACAQWLTRQLEAVADTVLVQQASVTTFDGTKLGLKNIYAAFRPEIENRVLLLAHWDCRPWADADPDPSMRRRPVMGANDAASGVAVLLELARCLRGMPPTVGVDILLVDVEDWGADGDEDSWALGTQYWARHPQWVSTTPHYGVLLDMVGARGARFAPEYFSMEYASGFVGHVWNVAREAGYGNYFVGTQGGAVTDDHIYINRIAGIPCLDIIDMRPDQEGSGFFSAWHTTHDTMDQIDPSTLKAVGQTLLHLLY